MEPVDYNWWMDRVKSLANSAMQPLLNTFASLPVKETDGQLMRFSSDMAHRNGSGLQQLERMVVWMRQRGFLPPPQHPAGSLPLPARPAKPAAQHATGGGLGDAVEVVFLQLILLCNTFFCSARGANQ